MHRDRRAHVTGDDAATAAERVVEEAWRDDFAYLLGLATKMLADRAEAEDVVQEAFSRLTRVGAADVDDRRGWLVVVTRRLCLDRLRSARARREAATPDTETVGDPLVDPFIGLDPADRVTLDDQVQMALVIVLDRLSPAERTAFVLHDVFGFPYTTIGEMVGRSPTACRQLASRARRSLRAGGGGRHTAVASSEQRAVAERFITACAEGDIDGLMQVLDPSVAGEAALLDHGPLARLEGRPIVAQRLIGLFGPATATSMVPVQIGDAPGVVAITRGRVTAVIRLDTRAGLVHHIKTWVRRAT